MASEYVYKPVAIFFNKGGSSSRYLRQTVLLSSFETPQVRALFNSNELLKNVAGRVRQTRQYGPISIPEGLALVSRA